MTKRPMPSPEEFDAALPDKARVFSKARQELCSHLRTSPSMANRWVYDSPHLVVFAVDFQGTAVQVFKYGARPTPWVEWAEVFPDLPPPRITRDGEADTTDPYDGRDSRPNRDAAYVATLTVLNALSETTTRGDAERAEQAKVRRAEEQAKIKATMGGAIRATRAMLTLAGIERQGRTLRADLMDVGEGEQRFLTLTLQDAEIDAWEKFLHETFDTQGAEA